MSRTVRPRAVIAAVLCAALVPLAAAGGYAAGARRGSEQERRHGASLADFWRAWDELDARYVGDASKADRTDGAIAGMVAALKDPYTTYFPKSQAGIFQDDLRGSFGGIGAELQVKDGQLTVVSALPGTPAEGAGLKGGDAVSAIDGVPTGGLSFTDAVAKIRGEIGTTVKLTIVRPGADGPLDVPVKRGTITVKSVSSDRIGGGRKTAYVKVNQFGQDTTSAFRDAVLAAGSDGSTGLVLDLRSNPGGYLQDAVDMAGMLLAPKDGGDAALKERVIVKQKGKGGAEESYRAGAAAILPELPVVVVVNGGSASASEIFAGALKDYGRAKLVGTKTFGKGSVQDLVPLSKANGGSIKVTIAKWFTPLGSGIDGTGIVPDQLVELPQGAVPGSGDAQVAAALALLP